MLSHASRIFAASNNHFVIAIMPGDFSQFFSPPVPFSLSLSLSKNGRTLACRKLKVRDVTSGTVDLPRDPRRNFILTNRDERKPRDFTDTFLLSLSPFSFLFSLRSWFFYPSHAFRDAATHPPRSDVEFPIKFPLSSPIAILHHLLPPLTPCQFVLFRGNDPPVIIDSA